MDPASLRAHALPVPDWRGSLWGGVLWIALASPAAAQDGGVVGRVVEYGSGRPLAGVTVTMLGAGFRAVTDEAGRFTLTQLGPGLYHLEFRLLGHATRVDSVRLAPGDLADLDVRLSVEPVALPSIAVTMRTGSITAWLAARGFAKRGLEGNAELHLDYDELRHLRYRNLREVLRNVPGVRIRRLVDAGSELRLDPDPRTGTGSCRVDVYLNGSNVEFGTFNWTGPGLGDRAARPIRFDDLLRLGEIDGIELYGPEDSPVAHDSACGSLLLWSALWRPVVNEEFTGSVRGVAVDERTGTPIADVRVTLEGTGLSVVTGAEGRFEIPSVLPGRYRVFAEYPGADRWEQWIDVKAYGNVDLELRIERT